MKFIELLACGTGLASGLAATWLSIHVARRLGDQSFWHQLSVVARSLLRTDDEVHLFREYVRLLRLLFQYTVRQAAILFIAFLPVGIAFHGLTTLSSRQWSKDAMPVQVSSTQPLTIDLSGQLQHLDASHVLPASLGLNRPAAIFVNKGQFHCSTLMQKQAYAPQWGQQLLLLSLGFEILHLDKPAEGRTCLVLFRPFSDDTNVLWPYLSDWEFVFFVAVSLASFLGILTKKFRA